MGLIISITTAVANILLGLFAYSKNPRSATHRLLALLTFLFAVWAITNYLSLHAKSESAALLWARMDVVITSTWGPVLLLLVHTFPRTHITLRPLYRLYILLFMGLTTLSAIFPSVFTTLLHPEVGRSLFLINFYGFLVATIVLLVRKYKNFKGKERTQIKYLALGIIINLVLSNITYFILVIVLKLSAFAILNPAFTLIQVAFITYAIVKHRFLDIRLIVARTVSYTALVAFIGVVYALALALIGSRLSDIRPAPYIFVSSTLLTLVVAFSFQPISIWLQKVTDHVLYKDHYDTDTLLYQVALIMASNPELKELTDKLLQKMCHDMRLQQASIVLFRRRKPESIFTHQADASFLLTHEEFSTLSELNHHRPLIFFDELPEDNIKEMLRQKTIGVVITLSVSPEQHGYLALGLKQSGNVYTTEDEKVLKILAPQITLSLQNAQKFAQIQQFNSILKREVTKATTSLRHANTRLKELDKLKDDFISVASHELRTPLTAIQGYLWIVMKQASTLPPKIQEHIKRALIASERLIELTNDILDVSKIESGQFSMDARIFDITKLTSEVKDEFSSKAQQKKIKMLLETSRSFKVNADMSKTRRVLINLLNNAIKFTKQGRIMIKIQSKDNMVKITISDTGTGIAPNDLEKLFQKFTQINRSSLREYREAGTGLGLYICREIVRMSGGQIDVTSKLGKGSQFSFTLPKA